MFFCCLKVFSILQLLERYWLATQLLSKKVNGYTNLRWVFWLFTIIYCLCYWLLIQMWLFLSCFDISQYIACWYSLAGHPSNNTSFSENDREHVNSTERQGFLKIHLLKVISLKSSKCQTERSYNVGKKIYWNSENNEGKILAPDEPGQGIFGKRKVYKKTCYCHHLITEISCSMYNRNDEETALR